MDVAVGGGGYSPGSEREGGRLSVISTGTHLDRERALTEQYDIPCFHRISSEGTYHAHQC